MKALTVTLFTLAITLPVLGQSPAAPGGTVSQPQPVPQAQTPAQPATPAAPAASPVPVDNSKVVVPADTTVPLVLRNTINSRTAYVGQAIYCETIFPITVGNRIVIPVNSSVKGSVTQVIHAGRVKGRAQIGLRFDDLILPSGTTVPLRAVLSGVGTAGKEGFNPNESKVEGASSKGDEGGKIAQSTMEGAGLGTMIGWAKGRPLTGLGVGSAAGAGGGLIWALASKRQELVLRRGTDLEMQLSVPLTFNREEARPATYRDEEPPPVLRRDTEPEN